MTHSSALNRAALAAAHHATKAAGGHIHVTVHEAEFAILIAGLLLFAGIYKLLPDGPRIGGRRPPAPQKQPGRRGSRQRQAQAPNTQVW